MTSSQFLFSFGVAVLVGVASWFYVRRQRRRSSTRRDAVVLPARVEDVSASFLTRAVLGASAAAAGDVHVSAAAVRQLDGGVHYQVAQVQLHYAPTRPDGAPRSVVVKLFTGALSGWQRALLRLDERVSPRVARRLWPAFHATAVRLKSYKIESRLYKRYSRLLSIPTPHAYFCHSDVHEVQFVAVLEDLCGMSRGEPDGFALRHAEHLVRALARFHRSSLLNAELPHLLAADKFWPHGGYWFGPKEMLYGSDAVDAIEHLLAAFGSDAFDAAECALFRDTARQLRRVADRLTAIVHALEPRVLLHGDYKISNLFIDDHDTVFAIDWQWLGGGNPATDLAYFVHTSVRYDELVRRPSDVEPSCKCDELRLAEQLGRQIETERNYDAHVRGEPHGDAVVDDADVGEPIDERQFYHYYGDSEWSLLRAYFAELALPATLTFASFERAYRLNVIYFAYFAMRCKYSWLTPEHMHRFATVPEDGLHLRKLSHLKLLVKRAAVLLRHSASIH